MIYTRPNFRAALDVKAKAFFERLHLVPGLAPICALCHYALGAHVPDARSATIS